MTTSTALTIGSLCTIMALGMLTYATGNHTVAGAIVGYVLGRIVSEL